MSQNKKSQLTSMISFLMFIASIALWYFLILPQFEKFKNTSNQSAVLTAKAEALNKNYATLELLKGQLTSTLNDQNKLDISVPKETQIPEIFIAIESLAQKAGVVVVSIKPENDAKDHMVKTVVVVESEYQNLKNFMASISKNIRPLVTESFKVIKTASETTSRATINSDNVETSGKSLQSEIIIYFATAQENVQPNNTSGGSTNAE